MEKSDVSNEEIRKRALNLLDFLISGIPEKREKTQGRKTEKKVERATHLLVDYKDEKYSKGWYFCVPRAFRDALDIKLTDRVIKKQPVKM